MSYGTPTLCPVCNQWHGQEIYCGGSPYVIGGARKRVDGSVASDPRWNTVREQSFASDLGADVLDSLQADCEALAHAARRMLQANDCAFKAAEKWDGGEQQYSFNSHADRYRREVERQLGGGACADCEDLGPFKNWPNFTCKECGTTYNRREVDRQLNWNADTGAGS